jgi:hypothetical protein
MNDAATVFDSGPLSGVVRLVEDAEIGSGDPVAHDGLGVSDANRKDAVLEDDDGQKGAAREGDVDA